MAQSGADQVFVSIGYGGKWVDGNDYEMKYTDEGCEATLKIHRSGQLNSCFQDRANNWDNNNGCNWSCKIDPSRFKQ